MKHDKKEWTRWMAKPPKKKKKEVDEENYDLFVELCAAEELVKELKEEIRVMRLKEDSQYSMKISNRSSSLSHAMDAVNYEVRQAYFSGAGGGGGGSGLTAYSGDVTGASLSNGQPLHGNVGLRYEPAE